MEYQKVCTECGEKFIARKVYAQYCPSCKYERANEQHKAAVNKKRKK